MSNLSLISSLVEKTQSKFNKIYDDNGVVFEREKCFAIQAFASNDYLLKVALNNQSKTMAAICNVAAMGITLNPASKEAYLVPRNNSVCLDISYMGLLKAAKQDGACIAGRSAIVYANDDFCLTGQFSEPQHKHNPFLNTNERGDIVGAYATLKIDENTYQTETMSREELDKIRLLNEAEKKGKHSPWKSFPEEMMKKTVLKRALKLVKGKNGTIDNIVNYMNENGEGITFNNQPDLKIVKPQNPEDEILDMIKHEEIENA